MSRYMISYLSLLYFYWFLCVQKLLYIKPIDHPSINVIYLFTFTYIYNTERYFKTYYIDYSWLNRMHRWTETECEWLNRENVRWKMKREFYFNEPEISMNSEFLHRMLHTKNSAAAFIWIPIYFLLMVQRYGVFNL